MNAVRFSGCVAALVLLPGSATFGDDGRSVRELRYEPVDENRSRTVPVKVYLPEEQNAQPVVLFSHGLGGSRENNAYLGKFWAEAGYVAVFMQHPGSDEDVWKTVSGGQRLAALKSAASAVSSRDRLADVSFVIDQLGVWDKQDGHDLFAKLDLEHIGMSGHSFGAVTTLGVAGQVYPFNRSFADDRIDAFLPMSPQPGKGRDTAKTFGHITRPILCMTGTKDASPIDPTVTPARRREVYAALPPGDKYQLVLFDAEHMAFGDARGLRARRRDPKHHPAIQQISLKFWSAYLKDDAEARSWLQSQQPISGTGLGSDDVWEWK
ncbi:MAG: dienelactone hydrolase [Planctomycetaceae bacterium]